MAGYNVTVRFSGRIEYHITDAGSEAEAMTRAEELAAEETRLGALEDIDWEAKSAYRT